jgi:FMN-dependent NADH-azoreductase
MSLLHISSSPRGAASESLQIADAFLEGYRGTHANVDIQTWDLWDGSLPTFGPPAAAAKMTIFGGGTPQGEQGAAWQAAQAAFERFDASNRLLFSVPMWNASVPYILKQFIDVISQPGMVFSVHPDTGYNHLLENKDKKAAVIYTSAVWAPPLGGEFGTNFHSTYFDDWLRWTGITDITDLRYHPMLTGDADNERRQAHQTARQAGRSF